MSTITVTYVTKILTWLAYLFNVGIWIVAWTSIHVHVFVHNWNLVVKGVTLAGQWGRITFVRLWENVRIANTIATNGTLWSVNCKTNIMLILSPTWINTVSFERTVICHEYTHLYVPTMVFPLIFWSGWTMLNNVIFIILRNHRLYDVKVPMVLTILIDKQL